jgi:hypothetical protein
MVTIIDGISGIVGVPPPPVIFNILASALSPVIYNCKISFAVNDKKYSTVKQFSTLAVKRIRVFDLGTDTLLITGKISR